MRYNPPQVPVRFRRLLRPPRRAQLCRARHPSDARRRRGDLQPLEHRAKIHDGDHHRRQRMADLAARQQAEISARICIAEKGAALPIPSAAPTPALAPRWDHGTASSPACARTSNTHRRRPWWESFPRRLTSPSCSRPPDWLPAYLHAGRRRPVCGRHRRVHRRRPATPSVHPGGGVRPERLWISPPRGVSLRALACGSRPDLRAENPGPMLIIGVRQRNDAVWVLS